MKDNRIGACILAAGKGTRMHSVSPKVLLKILHEPMLRFIYKELDQLFPEFLYTIIGHGAEDVRRAFPERAPDSFVLQEEQLGTGHALQCAWSAFDNAGLTHVLVVNGDTPFLSAAMARSFMAQSLELDADIAFLSITLDDPGAYGRVVRNNEAVQSIIEAKDYDPAVHGPEPREINAGVYCLKIESIAPVLGRLHNNNKSKEFYITDLIGLCVSAGMRVIGCNMGNDARLLGINSPLELVQAEEELRRRIVSDWQVKGVCIRQPESVRIGPDVILAPGAQICGPCELYGTTELHGDVQIESHCVLINSSVNAGSVVKSFSHLEKAVVGENCQVGPYARLRPGAMLQESSRVGNFVEVKNAVLGKGAKASHLTYLGDADIGAGSNIGAGTITCNYDGKNKHRTTIGQGAFIGSNTALVAPVEVGEQALVAAGSVITKNVPAKALAVGRARQENKERRNSFLICGK